MHVPQYSPRSGVLSDLRDIKKLPCHPTMSRAVAYTVNIELLLGESGKI